MSTQSSLSQVSGVQSSGCPSTNELPQPNWSYMMTDYGTCNLCGNIKKCELSEGFLYIEAEELALITDFRVLLKNRFKDLEIYFATEDPENETYVTNDADGKYFHDLPDDHFIAPLDY